MGSMAIEPLLAVGDEKEFNVLVTGFGPFLENKINPSYLIAAALPKQLILPNLPRIRIHTYPEPIEVSYANVVTLVPQLLPASYDLTLNIGMAPSRAYFALETSAHCSGYEKRDIRGEVPRDNFWQETYNAPPLLRPTFDPEDVWRRWKSVLATEDVRLSDDAGRFLCDYIYYASILEYWLQDPLGERPCAFLHVPGPAEPKDVLRGVRVALAAIGAIVGSLIVRRKEGKGIYASAATATAPESTAGLMEGV